MIQCENKRSLQTNVKKTKTSLKTIERNGLYDTWATVDLLLLHHFEEILNRMTVRVRILLIFISLLIGRYKETLCWAEKRQHHHPFCESSCAGVRKLNKLSCLLLCDQEYSAVMYRTKQKKEDYCEKFHQRGIWQKRVSGCISKRTTVPSLGSKWIDLLHIDLDYHMVKENTVHNNQWHSTKTVFNLNHQQSKLRTKSWIRKPIFQPPNNTPVFYRFITKLLQCI